MFSHRSGRLARTIAVGSLVAGALAALPVAQASAATGGGTAAAESGSTFVSFASFIKATSGAQYSQAAVAEGAAMTADSQAFGQMQAYILNHYRGVQVEHSFVLNGAYFDCAITSTQPSVRDLGIAKIATPPTSLPGVRPAGAQATSPLTQGLTDAYGNKISCPSGTIPMRRMTLEETTRFPTLAAYLGKQPGTTTPPTIDPGPAHRYAVGYQYVNNHGGNSWLNLWNPSGEFSLSQQWYVNGSGSGTQTAEGGWVHYPAKFGNLAVLFIFFTPNNYSSGCYNLDCSGFVQTSSAVTLGGTFTNYSTDGGTQWGFALQYQWYQGNWWLYYQGSAVGYYPGSVYNGGPMATGSNLTEYGGETYTAGSSWPQMGSGAFASAGWTHAAYQNTIFYIDTGSVSNWSSLSPIVTNPGCYTFAYTPASSGGSWGTYFFFGGPGGIC